MRIIKNFVISSVSLYIISQIFSGMIFSEGVKTLLITGAVLSLTSHIVKPVINILLLPLNLVTFGLFRWVAYVITLYLVTMLVPGFEITGFDFAGISTFWFSFPVISLSGILAFISFSFVVSFVTSIIQWVLK